MNLAHEITPAKLRSGDPGALAGLCDRRGGAVYAYCRRAAGDAAAAGLAAEAFAEFRRAIRAPGSLSGGGQAEALLRGVTRRVARPHQRHGLTSGDGSPVATPCEGREREILGYADKTLTPADREIFKIHIGHCRSCAALLQALRDAEPAFKVAPGTPVPFLVAREILGALVRAEPVTEHGHDEDAVGDEALRLLAGAGAAATEVSTGPEPVEAEPPAAPEPSSGSSLAQPADDPVPQKTAPPPVASAIPPAPPRPPSPVPPPAPPRGWRLLQSRLPWPRRDGYGPGRLGMVLRGLARFVVVVALAGVAGVGLGIGLAELTGDDETPPSPAVEPTSSTPAPKPAATREKVPVEISSTTVRAVRGNDDAEAASVRVRVRVENASGRAVRPEPPQMLVNDTRVAPEPASDAGARELLAPSLAPGTVAEGTLRFDVASMTTAELTAARVRLRITGKFVVLSPKLVESVSAG